MSTSSRDSSPSPREEVNLPSELAHLSSCIEERPEGFGQGDKGTQLAALQAAKYVFDLALKTEAESRSHISSLLSSLSPSLAPQTRSQAIANEKTGRDKHLEDSIPNTPALEDTPVSELCVEGMDEDQLWAQLELRAERVCEVLDFALETGEDEDEEEEGDREPKVAKKRKLEDGVEGDMDVDYLDDLGMGDEDEEEEDSDDDDSDFSDQESEESDEDEEEGDEELGEDVAELRDPSDEEGESSSSDLDKPSASGVKRPSRWKPKAGAHAQLDDGFFSLAAFNAETEEAETKTVSKGRLSADDEDSDEDMDQEIDYFTVVDDGADGEHDGTQEIFYKDFFEPPSRVPSKPKKPKDAASHKQPNGKVRFHEEVRVKKIRAKGKNLPVSSMFDEEEDDSDYDEEMAEADASDSSENPSEVDSDQEMDTLDGSEGTDASEGLEPRETIERLRDDLFADDDGELDTGLSTHEKRLAALQEEIVALESENVAQKHWTLVGEATSRSRPQNALLEEDLEFERVMKSVPVITEEVAQGLEERIKARIIEGRFDDVVRKRPLDDKPFLPSRFFELQDTKSKQSLAEIYEDEYTATQTGGAAGEDRDGKLRKEHEEIEKLWENISGKLDALCNAHFTPKAPKATISTVSNVAAATLESALPTTKSTSTMLAPEEVFAPSSSDLQARSELTPTQKRTLRNKEKKSRKKAKDTLEKGVDKFAKMKGISGVKRQKEAALKSIVKNGKGVTVVGKKGTGILANGKKGKTRS